MSRKISKYLSRVIKSSNSYVCVPSSLVSILYEQEAPAEVDDGNSVF